jgi:Family of unknown function (DUF6518)
VVRGARLWAKVIRWEDDGAAHPSQAGRMTASSADPGRATSTSGIASGSSTALRVVIVLLAAALAGSLTPLGEHLLPRSINAVANSSGPWTIITFVLVYASRVRGWRAAVLAASALVIMDVTFYFFFDALGGYYPHRYLAFWVFIALCVGPLVGLCASWIRSSNPRLQEIAVAAPCAVLIGEGVFMLARLPELSIIYPVLSLVVGATLLGALAVSQLKQPARIAISFAVCAAASVAFLEVYGLVPLVLDKVVP